jgi:hypothetical protein
MKDLQNPGADIDSDHNLLVAKVYVRLKETVQFPKNNTKVESGEVIYSTRESASTLEEKLGEIECESGNVRVQWNNNKHLLDTNERFDWDK